MSAASPTPEEMAQRFELPNQRALMDFDIKSSDLQVLGANPIDLSSIPNEPVKSLVTPWAVVTIVAHHGEEQEVADLMAEDPRLVQMVLHYAEHYHEQGENDFAINALTDEQIRNVERHTGRRIQQPDH